MAKRQRKQNSKCLIVIVRHIAAPDAKQRLSLAVNILLRVTAKSTVSEEEGLTTSKLNDTVKGQRDA